MLLSHVPACSMRSKEKTAAREPLAPGIGADIMGTNQWGRRRSAPPGGLVFAAAPSIASPSPGTGETDGVSVGVAAGGSDGLIRKPEASSHRPASELRPRSDLGGHGS